MNARAVLLLTAGGLLLLSTSTARASVEAGEGMALPSFDLDNLLDKTDTFMNVITEQPANVANDVAGRNISAFIGMIHWAEGTASQADPYAVCYGYRHTVQNFANHPAVTGEWRGEKLSDAMCANAGFGPGCVSTAAGAAQIIKPTWVRLAAKLGLPDFSPASQDAATVELIRSRGALEDVKAGRVADAIVKCKNEWASLPGNYAKQGQRSIANLVAQYQQNGGYTA